MSSTKRKLNVVRSLAFASVALLALPAHADDKQNNENNQNGKGGKVTVVAATPVTGGSVRSMSGTLSPFNGTLSPFGGTLSPFSGTLSPFYGTLSPFSGTLSPFSGTLSPSSGTLSPFWGDLSKFNGQYSLNTPGTVRPDFAGMGTFWNGVSTQWTAINSAWTAAAKPADFTSLAGKLNTLVSTSQAYWGASVTARTGKSFNDGFAKPLMAAYGIDPSSPDSLANVTEAQRSRFLLAWFDGLMNFAGVDHVDHWMSEVNWSPALTQVQGAGSNTTIGLLDFTVKANADLLATISTSGGISTYSNGHGTAVASLIVSAHDGVGVMGIAPRAEVVAYNPFDASGTANWTDITNGAIMLEKNDASIINASLGVPGYTLHPDWNTVLTNKGLKDARSNVVFVIAAGNDGITQTGNVAWAKDNAKFLVVGSIDPNLNISSFSNRPGNVCLTDRGKCGGDYLMNHFIVASGENILVANDAGSITRMTGTSFATPLVSGAIALLHDRWPWLADHPVDTINIITKSAKDLGAPGVDPVYGVGLLDVQASQSPLSYDALQWWTPKTGLAVLLSLDKLQTTTVAALRDPKQQALWEANSIYVYGFEKLSESYRDFSIPLSSKLMGQSVTTATGGQQQLQGYLTSSFKKWAGAAFANSPSASSKGFLNFSAGLAAPIKTSGGYTFAFNAAPREEEQGWRSSGVGFSSQMAVTSPDASTALKFGYGEGAASVSGVTGFGLHSDYDPMHGGANPLLGFASGGAYGAIDFVVAPRLKLTGGMTRRDARRDLESMTGRDRLAALAVGDYKSDAARVGFTWRATDRLQLTSGFTRLNERSALLGVQSTDPSDLGHGSSTMGLDVGADFDAGHGFTLSGAVTRGKVQSSGSQQNLSVGEGGLSTSSFQVAMAKTGLIGDDDRLRLSLSQPMHIEGGKLNYSGLQVVDRQTGELGVVTQSFSAATGARPFVAELLYATPIFGGNGELGVFSRAENRGLALDGTTTAVFTAGAKMKLRY